MADGSDENLRLAALLVGLVDHACWLFYVEHGYTPDLGVLDDRLDLLREILEASR